MQDLNQSPIDLDEQAVVSSNNSLSQSEQVEGQECETFKGSFLMEMQKLTRPLIFEKHPYNIYSLEYQQSDDHILCFMQRQMQDEPFVLKVEKEQVQEYIVDFHEENEEVCCCKCHEKKNDKEQFKLIRRNSESTLFGRESNQTMPENQRKDLKPRTSLKKWTSISLKEYKQHIKKKLNEKR